MRNQSFGDIAGEHTADVHIMLCAYGHDVEVRDLTIVIEIRFTAFP